MNGTEIEMLFIQGALNAIYQAAKIWVPYAIIFCILCILIGSIKSILRRRK